MIKQFFKPASVDEALKLKGQFQDEAVWMAGGTKLNATPTRTSKTVAISLAGLGFNKIDSTGSQLRIGAGVTLQALIDHAQVPCALKEAAGFVYSRHIRNQATVGGEVCACQVESVLLPILLVLDAEVVLADGKSQALEQYLAAPKGALVAAIVLPDPKRVCATEKVSRSAAGLIVLTAAVALDAQGKQLIAVDGVTQSAARLKDVEAKGLQETALEQAVSQAVAPKEDLRGSVAYKRYISGVIVADLLAKCLQKKGGK